jgi:hypothetical protein
MFPDMPAGVSARLSIHRLALPVAIEMQITTSGRHALNCLSMVKATLNPEVLNK